MYYNVKRENRRHDNDGRRDDRYYEHVYNRRTYEVTFLRETIKNMEGAILGGGTSHYSFNPL